MNYTGKDYKGVGLFCQCVIHLIDSGKSEELNKILDEMKNGNLVTYILGRYETRFTTEAYDIKALNEFFHNHSTYAESSKSGVYGENNGLLAILSVVLMETEYQVVNWKEK